MPERSPTPPRRRGAIALLLDPVFGGIFWGKLLSLGGVWIHGVVATIVVFDATGSAFAAGLVSIAQFSPQLLLTPISGTMADRGHAWGQMVAGRALCTLGSGCLAIWLIAAGPLDGWARAWPVLAATLVVGLGFVVGGPAQQSVIPLLVSREELPTAMTLNTAPMTISRVLGPAAGALVAARLGPAEAFAIAAGAHLGFTIILVCIRLPAGEPRSADADYSVRAAMGYVRRHPSLLVALGAVAAAGVGSEPTITLAPALVDDLGGDTALVGILASGFGAGSALGLVSLGAFRSLTSIAMASTTGLGLMAVGAAVVAALAVVPAALLGFAIAGLGFTWSMSSLGALVQIEAPAVLRGRIMALWIVAFVGSRPVAASAMGAIADAVSARTAMALMAALLAITAVLCRPARLAPRA